MVFTAGTHSLSRQYWRLRTAHCSYDNYGAEGTADKAMRTIRAGGVYLMMPHGECFVKKTQGPPCLSANPKDGTYCGGREHTLWHTRTHERAHRDSH